MSDDADTSTAPSPSVVLAGPTSHANWVAFDTGGAKTSGSEITLYSDIRFTGEILEGLGPYKVLNLIRVDEGRMGPALALRLTLHVQFNVEAKNLDTDVTDYTGSSLGDEIAVLISLAHGSRVAAGGETRRFDQDDPCASVNTQNRPVVDT